MDDKIAALRAEIVAEMDSRFIELENILEERYYALLAQRASKKTLEEIVELSVIEHFGVNRRDFRGKFFTKRTRIKREETADSKIVDARGWFMSLMRYVLLRSPYQLKNTYPFYHVKKEQAHRPIFNGAISPQSVRESENRKTLLAISALIKQKAEQEGVFENELFDFL